MSAQMFQATIGFFALKCHSEELVSFYYLLTITIIYC